jgi:hypothetical protein
VKRLVFGKVKYKISVAQPKELSAKNTKTNAEGRVKFRRLACRKMREEQVLIL